MREKVRKIKLKGRYYEAQFFPESNLEEGKVDNIVGLPYIISSRGTFFRVSITEESKFLFLSSERDFSVEDGMWVCFETPETPFGGKNLWAYNLKPIL